MRILFVAPQSGLSVGAELAKVASGNQVSVCDGMVDRSKLALALRQEPFDVIHFAQHGSRNGLDLTDGTLEVADLVSMLERQTGLRLMFVNACQSAAVGIELHNAFHAPVIAHDAPITDQAALLFAEVFYRALATTEIGTAFGRALRTLQMRFPDDGRTPQLINGDMAQRSALDNLRNEMTGAFEHFNRRLDQVEAAVLALDSGRNRHITVMILVILVALLVAQVLTPLLNAALIHLP